jgi:hypothetical protein
MTDTPVAITVDTSVLIGAVKGDCPMALEVFERAMSGDLDLAVTTRVDYELTKTELPVPLAEFLKTRPVLGAPARWGVSKWGGGDTWAGPSSPNPSTDRIDSDHLEAHKASGRQFFVTCDKGRMLRFAEERGIVALSPTELLERLDKG